MKKGPVELGSDEEEGKSDGKVINQIFGRLQYPKNELRYLENIFQTLEAIFPYKGGGAYTSCKHKYHNIYKNKDF